MCSFNKDINNFHISISVSEKYHRPGDSSSMDLGFRLDDLGVGGVENFLHPLVCRLVLGSTQPPTKISTGGFPRG